MLNLALFLFLVHGQLLSHALDCVWEEEMMCNQCDGLAVQTNMPKHQFH
jgi:hypothetical protein